MLAETPSSGEYGSWNCPLHIHFLYTDKTTQQSLNQKCGLPQDVHRLRKRPKNNFNKLRHKPWAGNNPWQYSWSLYYLIIFKVIRRHEFTMICAHQWEGWDLLTLKSLCLHTVITYKWKHSNPHFFITTVNYWYMIFSLKSQEFLRFGLSVVYTTEHR